MSKKRSWSNGLPKQHKPSVLQRTLVDPKGETKNSSDGKTPKGSTTIFSGKKVLTKVDSSSPAVDRNRPAAKQIFSGGMKSKSLDSRSTERDAESEKAKSEGELSDSGTEEDELSDEGGDEPSEEGDSHNLKDSSTPASSKPLKSGTKKLSSTSQSDSDDRDLLAFMLEDERKDKIVERMAADKNIRMMGATKSSFILQTSEVVRLTAFDQQQTEKFDSYCRGVEAAGQAVNWDTSIQQDVLQACLLAFGAHGLTPDELSTYQKWNASIFFHWYYKVFPSLAPTYRLYDGFNIEGQILSLTPMVEALNRSNDLFTDFMKFITVLTVILEKEFPKGILPVPEDKKQHFADIREHTLRLFGKKQEFNPNTTKTVRGQLRRLFDLEFSRTAVTCVHTFLAVMTRVAKESGDLLNRAALFGATLGGRERVNSSSRDSRHQSHSQQQQNSHKQQHKQQQTKSTGEGKFQSNKSPKGDLKRKPETSESSTRRCRGCGHTGHSTDQCYGKGHSGIVGYNYNPDIEWIESEGSRMFPDRDSLPMKNIFDVIGPVKKKNKDKDKSNSFKRQKTGEYRFGDFKYVLHLSSGKNLTGATWPVTIAIPSTNISYEINALLDSGALQANYGSFALQDLLQAKGLRPNPCSDIICSAFGECRRCRSQFFLFVTLNNDLGQQQIFPIVVKIIDIEFDLIIGRPTIRAQKLEGIISANTQNDDVETVCFVKEAEGELEEASASRTDGYLSTTSATRPHANNTIHMSQIFPHEETDYLDDEFLDRSTWWETKDLDGIPVEDHLKVHIEGPPSLQEKLRKLVGEFKDIFDVNPSKEPATLPPMELVVDREAWQCSKNRTPPRPQTLEKQKEIMRQIEQMKERGIIVESQATEFSQVLLQPKPNNKWRFCIDYRALNLVSKGAGWPIPMISMLLQRIGSKRARFFGVMDLTSGYHQMPMSKMAQVFTAFITFMGIFEFTRVPFGLKGAPSYFQQLMATIVLAGLIYTICEVYLDDIIVYATTEDEFVEYLREVFKRLRKFSVKLHPEKTNLGMSSIEYVGHVIDENGLSFSDAKRDKVLQCPKPTKEKHMKSFLGVANYFRDHIRDYATIVHPLQEMIRNYDRSRLLRWSPAANKAWDDIRAAINDCPKLFFLNPQAPVFLHTDASAYGIGAYLFQIVDGVHQPIAFISKALSSQQRLKWTVPEKEAYAIYYSFQKLEYLIRDVQFTLRTDHQNLTFLTQAGSRRVLTWKLAIQEFNFNIEYIKGPDNFVADCFSRELMDSGDDPEMDIVRVEKLNTLFHKSEREPIPTQEYNLISGVHNSFVGHHGEERTMQKLIRKGQSWPNMRKHVKSFIKACPACQKMSYKSHIINAKPFTLARYEPMERINVDSIGPLPEDKWGNKYIITIIDCFTRFVELYPAPDTTADVAARALLHFVGRYGSPAEIMSDNGSQYVNRLITEFCKLIGTEHPTSLAYSHEENGIVERANKEIQRHLKHILFDRNVLHDWSDCLPIVQRIINTTTHESIGVSPSQILFGNAISVDRGIFLPHDTRSREDESSTPFDTQHRGTMEFSDWAENMLARQASLIELAQSYQAKADGEHMNPSEPKRRRKTSTVAEDSTAVTHISEFPVDSYVLVSYPRSSFGNRRPPNKLMANLRGPLRVVSYVGSTYSLQDLVTNKLESVHVTQLRPFEYDPQRVEPRLIANKDQQMWEVEEIIAHRGNPKRRSSMTFRVRWTGFTEDDDTWEPWKNLRKNLKLHAYLRKSNLTALLPKPGEDEGA